MRNALAATLLAVTASTPVVALADAKVTYTIELPPKAPDGAVRMLADQCRSDSVTITPPRPGTLLPDSLSSQPDGCRFVVAYPGVPKLPAPRTVAFAFPNQPQLAGRVAIVQGDVVADYGPQPATDVIAANLGGTCGGAQLAYDDTPLPEVRFSYRKTLCLADYSGPALDEKRMSVTSGGERAEYRVFPSAAEAYAVQNADISKNVGIATWSRVRNLPTDGSTPVMVIGH